MKTTKKLISLMLAIALTVSLASVLLLSVSASTKAKLGDINGDGNIGSTDLVMVRKFILGIVSLDDNMKLVADINEDGKITSADLVAVRKAILSGTNLGEVDIDPLAPSLKVNPSVLEVEAGQNAVIRGIVTPYNAQDPSLTFSSGNTDIATVDQFGKVTGKKAGTTFVDVKYNASNITKTVSVIVHSSSTQNNDGSVNFDLRKFKLNQSETPLNEPIIYNDHWHSSSTNYLTWDLQVVKTGTYIFDLTVCNDQTATSQSMELYEQGETIPYSTVVVSNSKSDGWDSAKATKSATLISFNKTGVVTFKLKRPGAPQNILGASIRGTVNSVQNFNIPNEPSTSSIYMNWTAFPGASKYRIYKDNEKTYTEVTGTSYTATGLKERHPYKFAIEAIGSTGSVLTGDKSAVYALTKESDSAKEERLNWWTQARYGLFIHWGGYAAYGGDTLGTVGTDPQGRLLNSRGEFGRFRTARGLLASEVYKSGYSEDHVLADLDSKAVAKDGTIPVSGYSEWFMDYTKIPMNTYIAEVNKSFTGEDFDADEWVKTAVDAGMKYIVITSKHHEGFTLWPSGNTSASWNVADSAAGQNGRDYMQELSDAVKKANDNGHELHFGAYYSFATDWTAYGSAGAIGTMEENHYKKSEVMKYVKDVVIPNVNDLTNKYGVEILWWDYAMKEGSSDLNNEFRYEVLKEIYDNAPNPKKLIFNDRMSNTESNTGMKYFNEKDHDTPEQHIPFYNPWGRSDLWETCMTLNTNWGFAKYDISWKPKQEVLYKLTDIVSKNGNFLLNVGPSPDGVIPTASREILKEVGDWLKANNNGEAIYGTTASPFHSQLPWGRATQKVHKTGNTVTGTDLFLHVYSEKNSKYDNIWDDKERYEKDPNEEVWPTTTELKIPSLKTAPKNMKAYFLHDLSTSFDVVEDKSCNGYKIIGIPTAPPQYIEDGKDPSVTTFKLVFDSEVITEYNVQPVINQAPNGSITLTGATATIHDIDGDVDTTKFEKDYGNIGYWNTDLDYLTWKANITNPAATYNIEFEYAHSHSSSKSVDLIHVESGKQVTLTLAPTGGWVDYKKVTVNAMDLGVTVGNNNTFKLVRKGDAINAKTITLTPSN